MGKGQRKVPHLHRAVFVTGEHETAGARAHSAVDPPLLKEGTAYVAAVHCLQQAHALASGGAPDEQLVRLLDDLLHEYLLLVHVAKWACQAAKA